MSFELSPQSTLNLYSPELSKGNVIVSLSVVVCQIETKSSLFKISGVLYSFLLIDTLCLLSTVFSSTSSLWFSKLSLSSYTCDSLYSSSNNFRSSIILTFFVFILSFSIVKSPFVDASGICVNRDISIKANIIFLIFLTQLFCYSIIKQSLSFIMVCGIII